MKKSSKFLSLIIALIMIFSTLTIISNAATATSGSCGSNVKWNYDKKNYTVTISGNGEMANYSGESPFTKLAQNSTIRKVIIKSGVTGIGKNAFCSCHDLESVTIPESVTKIKAYAFSQTSLKKCTLPSKLKEIGNGAFCMTLLETIKIPDSVTSLGEEAFMDSSLKSCILSKNIKAIKDCTFAYTQLKSISIPKSVTSIGNDVFSASMKNLVIPANVKSIGNLFMYGDWYGKTIYCYNKNLKFPSTTDIIPGGGTVIYGQNNSTAQSFCTNYKKNSDLGNISFKSLSVSSSNVTLSYSSKACTGKALKPSVSVNDKNGYTVSSNNYTVKYSNNTNPGTATVTVKIKGNKTETIKKTFKITLNQVKNLKASSIKKNSVKLTWSKVTGAKYYTIFKSTDGKKWTEIKTVTSTEFNVSSLKAATKYYFRVTAMDSTKKIVSKASATLKVTTSK